MTLKGTGIEKRELERSVKAYEKEAKAAIEAAPDLLGAGEKFSDEVARHLSEMEADFRSRNIVL